MKILFTIFIVLNSIYSSAQNVSKAGSTPRANIPHGQNKTVLKDTTAAKDSSEINKEPRYFYLAGNMNVFVNTKGSFGQRFSPSVEFGRTYGIFDMGLATGRLNSISSGSDTTRFLEFRPTINIFTKGRFSEALCIGGGYVFKAKQGLMTEICNSINFNISEIWSVSVLQGYYFFDGTNSSRSTQFFGLNATYNFLQKHGINIKRKKKAILREN